MAKKIRTNGQRYEKVATQQPKPNLNDNEKNIRLEVMEHLTSKQATEQHIRTTAFAKTEFRF